MAGTNLPPAVVDKLLDKLGSDDAFRTQFQQNPKAALQTLGAPADFVAGACLSPKTLAPKEQFQKSRALFRDALLSQGNQKVFSLEAR